MWHLQLAPQTPKLVAEDKSSRLLHSFCVKTSAIQRKAKFLNCFLKASEVAPMSNLQQNLAQASAYYPGQHWRWCSFQHVVGADRDWCRTCAACAARRIGRGLQIQENPYGPCKEAHGTAALALWGAQSEAAIIKLGLVKFSKALRHSFCIYT